MKKISSFIVIAVLFTAIGLYFGTKRFQPGPPADTAVGALMQLSFKDSQDKQRKMSEWKGKTLLLNFWAPWCPPCVDEMPELVALQKDMTDKNLQIVGIGIDSPTNIRQFADKHQITYPLLISGLEGTELSRQFGNEAGGLPFTVLIAPDGTVRKTYMGRLNLEKVRADLASL